MQIFWAIKMPVQLKLHVPDFWLLLFLVKNILSRQLKHIASVSPSQRSHIELQLKH